MSVPPKARLVRALTDDRHIRFAALQATPLWDGVRRSHPHLEAGACAALTENLAAVSLLQSRGGFSERLQILLKGAGRAKAVVADSWPDGTLRGVLDVASPDPGGSWVAGPGLMQVMRSNAKGQPYIGHLELVEGDLAKQIEAYLQQSEQVQASLTLWCDEGSGVSGGLLVEPMPGCPPDRLHRLVQALEGLDVVPLWERTPEFLTDWISQGQGATVLTDADLDYRCRCQKASLVGTLSGFTQAQREDLFAEGDPIEVRCDYCGKVYHITRADLPGVPS
ncbi:MAG TPA: Hsp33 family molecular chaperone HslO [Holophagaceae bacterium]|jgi:molecular chaperone Hsp33|nr:Hsp33 family molecular chaperone HslO [Holophagaceae bacterium]